MPDDPVSPVKATATEEMNFDNEHDQETGKVSPLGTESADKGINMTKSPSPKPRVSFQEGPAEEIPPAKPPRPISPAVQAENTLIEAFPSIDTKVVKAVLQASGGQVEPAFNALLGMSDPNFKPETPPVQPPRPSIQQQPQPQRQPMSQLEADELYARQLAEHYSSSGGHGGQFYNQREPGRRGPNQQRPRYDEEDREHSFFDDDLPEIGKNIQQGFFDTQKKVNSWIMNFKKKLDGEDEEEDLYSGSSQQGGRVGTMSGGSGTLGGRKDFGPSQSEQLYGIRKSAEQQRRVDERRSMDAQRYDRDPQMIDDNEFQRLELRDDEDQPPPQPPRSSSTKRPANPDLFKPTPQPPQSGPVDEVDAAERKASGNGGNGNSQSKKWQPLTSVAPAPEEDNDPFSVGDDDENQDDKKEDQMKEASERLKSKASESMSEGGVKSGKILAESERSGSVGTKNKEADELLGGKKG